MAIHSYTLPLTGEQVEILRAVLERDGFEFTSKPHTVYAAKKDKVSVAVYKKGPKVLIQGKGTEEFVTFKLEPEVVGEAALGYEEELNPEMFSPHFGIDESGKGDFFGPLVIAGAYVDKSIARSLLDSGIQDSKRITSDQRIRALAKAIRETPGICLEVIRIGPARYNEMYAKIGNLNRMLAWGHARVIENLCEKKPDCPRALSDQFANPANLQRALQERGRGIELQQRTKAESDLAVAAASIIAREAFIDWLQEKGEELNTELPRGASARVKEVAKDIVERSGKECLPKVAKMHFKTSSEVLDN